MLILTRKKDESIIIENDIEIKVLDISEGKVKIGIEAPKDIEILRKELYFSVEEENIAAAESNIDLNNINKVFK